MKAWINAAILGVMILGTVAIAQTLYHKARAVVVPQQVAGETVTAAAVPKITGATYTNAVYGFSVLVPDGFVMHQQGKNFTMQKSDGGAGAVPSVAIVAGSSDSVIAQQTQGATDLVRSDTQVSGMAAVSVRFTRGGQKFSADFVGHRGVLYVLTIPATSEDLVSAVHDSFQIF